jgi:hypothetical protein
MQINFKSVFFGLSLLLNGIVILLLILSGFSKTSTFTFFNPDGDFLTAAAVVSVPKTQSASVESIVINLRPREKAFLQFSVISGQDKQGNMLFNALYDPGIISVSQTGFGMEITAVREGSVLIQTFSNDGIKNVAQVNVSE